VRRFLQLAIVLLPCFASAQDADTHKTAAQRIAFYADQFSKIAPTLTAKETLEQVRLDEKKLVKPRKKDEPWPPILKRTIVSKYGYAATPTGIREVRQIESVDGKPVRSGGNLLDALAAGVTAESDENRQKLLIDFEKNGLRGMVIDFAQIILLFSKGATEKYEFSYQNTEKAGEELFLVYRFEQIDGQQAVTIFNGKQPVKKRLQGEVWCRRSDLVPMRIFLQADHYEGKDLVRDMTTVDYGLAENMLFPGSVQHKQMRDGTVHVEDLFRYSDFRIAPRDK
jgi:hypothetical protein